MPKTLVYAEDILIAVMQYPSQHITKGIVKQLITDVAEEKSVSIGSLMPVASCGDYEDNNFGGTYD